MSFMIALSDAKAELSSVVRQVHETGVEYVVTVRNTPVAMIVPMPRPTPQTLRGFGILAREDSSVTKKEEKTAWAEAAEAKHAELV